MKLLRSVFLVSSLFSLSLFAQHGGGHGGGGGGFHGGGGGAVGGFRGGGGGFRGGYGGYYGGYRGFYGGYGLGFGLGLGYGWGWGYPYYYGYYGYPYYGYDPYYYGGYYGYPQTYQPYTVPAAPAAPAAPATTSYYRTPDYYLIAFNDHTIRAAASYQVIGDQIEWTPKEGGAVQRAPLASVDKTFTTQINRDRRVKMDLP